MNAPATPDTRAQLTANQAVIRGRIIDVERRDSYTLTDVVLPAPDQFSQPQNIRISSVRSIGRKGDDITQRVAIEGYRRKYTSKKTGEEGFAVDVRLTAIED